MISLGRENATTVAVTRYDFGLIPHSEYDDGTSLFLVHKKITSRLWGQETWPKLLAATICFFFTASSFMPVANKNRSEGEGDSPASIGSFAKRKSHPQPSAEEKQLFVPIPSPNHNLSL
ncbi:hypothetical protein ACFE04_021498 [Oxalis oulophora]